jgi:hypothetical protein
MAEAGENVRERNWEKVQIKVRLLKELSLWRRERFLCVGS